MCFFLVSAVRRIFFSGADRGKKNSPDIPKSPRRARAYRPGAQSREAASAGLFCRAPRHPRTQISRRGPRPRGKAAASSRALAEHTKGHATLHASRGGRRARCLRPIRNPNLRSMRKFPIENYNNSFVAIQNYIFPSLPSVLDFSFSRCHCCYRGVTM